MQRNILPDTKSHHQMTVRIPLEDVDVTGCMYHGNFLKYYDRARTDFLLSLGFSHRVMIDNSYFFVIKAVTQDFIKPVLLESIISVHSWVTKIGRSSLIFDHTFQDQESILTKATITLVLVSKDFKPLSLPPTMRDSLAPYNRPLA